MTNQISAVFLLFAGSLAAQQAGFTNTGGTVTLGTDFTIAGSTVASPAGTFAFDCPATALPPGQYQAEWVCNGGTITIQSSDGLTAVSGTVTSGTLIETASGGGKGGHTTYYYSFSGTFSGTMTVNGQAQAIRGSTSQAVGGLTAPLGTGTIASGSTNVNSAYEPLYITDTYNYRVVRMDNMNGDNWTTLGTFGVGVKQFSFPWGIAVDGAGRIYVTDSSNCRVVRMDDMTGKNWTSIGVCGASSLQFNNPAGIAVDASGKIYVADSGNNRIVRMNDIAGDGWTTFGVAGSGTGQFSLALGVAVDAAGKIYVADSSNDRITRMDDMTGANWVSFGTPGAGTNQFSTTESITLDPAGKIYIVDIFNSRIVRIDDMSGTNWTVLGGTFGSGFAQFINPYGAGVDQYGTIYVADSRNYRLVMADDMTGLGWTTYGTGGTGVGGFDSPTSILPVPATAPIAVPALPTAPLVFSDTVVGTPSAAQTVTMTNIGSATLNIVSVTTSSDFKQTNNCGSSLPAGQSCIISVTFVPTAGGTRTGGLALNLGAAGVRTIKAGGVGSLVSLSTTALNFGNVFAGGLGASLSVTVANPGKAAAGITSVVLKAPTEYRLKSTCGTSLAAGANCTLTVKFYPQGAVYYTGLLTVTDASGAAQKVSITGTGVSN